MVSQAAIRVGEVKLGDLYEFMSQVKWYFARFNPDLSGVLRASRQKLEAGELEAAVEGFGELYKAVPYSAPQTKAVAARLYFNSDKYAAQQRQAAHTIQ